jgi:RNA polymerase sigma-70 factor (ECF subfamily)
MSDELTAQLISRWQTGDEQAAEELYARYADFLLGYIDKRMSEKLTRDGGPEDVLQSVYKSFFRAVGVGKFASLPRGELKKILTGLARNKICARARRVAEREKIAGAMKQITDPQAREWTSEEAAEVYDALEKCLGEEDDDGRTIISKFYFAGESEPAIAAELGISERSVRRTRSDFQKRLEQLLRPQ